MFVIYLLAILVWYFAILSLKWRHRISQLSVLNNYIMIPGDLMFLLYYVFVLTFNLFCSFGVLDDFKAIVFLLNNNHFLW